MHVARPAAVLGMIDPHPGLPPNRRSDLGEGEYNVWMNILFATHHEVLPPPFEDRKWGRCP
jgi:hypothetical protein